MKPVVKRVRFLMTLLEVSELDTSKFNYPSFFFFFLVIGFNKFFREDGINASLSWVSVI